jgi:nucleoside-diphosphate-sugar epimerase
MTTLVVGASGATGKLLLEQLLQSGHKVKIIVRPTSNFLDHWNSNEQLTIMKGNIAEITIEEMSVYMADCQSIACCLGHNLTWRGIFGKPRRLVANAVKLLCEAIKKNESSRQVRFVLMSTVAYRNKGLNEPISFGERIVIGLIRLFLPPHSDNEKAADFLRTKLGQDDPFIEWVAVRPDTLINEKTVTEYSLHPSPLTSPVFKPGKSSRINVAHFMGRLLRENELWKTWKGQTPVIYNEEGKEK